jgi:hypothetical protein
MSFIMDNASKGALATSIYKAAYNTNMDLNNQFGEDILYLIGAILTDGTVILRDESSEFVKQLDNEAQEMLSPYIKEME